MSAFTSISEITNHRHRFVLLGAAIAFISLFGGWFDPATTPRLSAWQMGMAQAPSIPDAPFNLISFGVAGLFLICLVWLATWRKHGQLMLLASTGLCFLSLACYLQIGISRASWLQEAIDGSNDFQQTIAFANSYSISTGYDVLPDNGVSLKQLGISDRLTATSACLSYGWLWFTTSSLVCLAGSLKEAKDSALSLYPFLVWLTLLSLIILLQTSFATVAQYELQVGDEAAVRNDTVRAEAAYHNAIMLDEWYRLRPTVYLKIGVLRKSNGDTTSPEACLAIGEDLIARNYYPEGMYWLKLARQTHDRTLAHVVDTEICQLAITQALYTYKNGSQAAAKEELFLALEARPRQIAVYYMLGKAEYDMANYNAALQYFTRASAGNIQLVLRALCFSARGDCYYRMGQTAMARDCYLKSSSLLDMTDYRALKALTDNYFQ